MNHLKVMDFYADWCISCKAFDPIFESVYNQTKEVIFEKINIDNESDIAYTYKIRSIPTVIFEKDGKVVFRNSGSLTEIEFKKLIETHR
jgi:thioredoxin